LSGLLPWDSYYEPFLRRTVMEGKATAVLAYSHYGALSLLRTAHDLGLSVPKEFSLVCFNNEPVISLSIPSLTAVDVPSAAMGEAAAQILLQGMSVDGDNGEVFSKSCLSKVGGEVDRPRIDDNAETIELNICLGGRAE